MPDAGRCQFHPERDGVGLCMRCRAVICSECTTPIDGINHCIRCLESLRAEAAPMPRVAPTLPTRGIALALLFALSFALVLAFTVWTAARG